MDLEEPPAAPRLGEVCSYPGRSGEAVVVQNGGRDLCFVPGAEPRRQGGVRSDGLNVSFKLKLLTPILHNVRTDN